MHKDQNIFLIGPMGAGKSTIGKQLASMLGRELIDSDKAIEDKTGAEISWIFDVEGEDGFRRRESQMIDELTQLTGIVLATGGGAVLMPENRNYLAARGAVIYLKTSIEQQLERTKRDKKRPLLQDVDDPQDVLVQLMDMREPLYQETADYVVETDGRSIKAVANEIIDWVEGANSLGANP